MANQDDIYIYFQRQSGASEKEFGYKEVFAIAKNIIRATPGGLDYACLRFLQQYCVSDNDVGAAFISIRDPRKCGSVADLRKAWRFSLKNENHEKSVTSRRLAESKIRKANPQDKRKGGKPDRNVVFKCEKDFLDAKHTLPFIKFIIAREKQRDLNHKYEIKFKQWGKHLSEQANNTSVETLAEEGKQKIFLTLPSLSDAMTHYFWPTESAENEDDEEEDNQHVGTSFKENKKVLDGLSEALKCALNGNKDDATFLLCIKILEWGQVFKGSVRWVIDRHEKKTLVKDICAAVQMDL